MCEQAGALQSMPARHCSHVACWCRSSSTTRGAVPFSFWKTSGWLIRFSVGGGVYSGVSADVLVGLPHGGLQRRDARLDFRGLGRGLDLGGLLVLVDQDHRAGEVGDRAEDLFLGLVVVLGVEEAIDLLSLLHRLAQLEAGSDHPRDLKHRLALEGPRQANGVALRALAVCDLRDDMGEHGLQLLVVRHFVLLRGKGVGAPCKRALMDQSRDEIAVMMLWLLAHQRAIAGVFSSSLSRRQAALAKVTENSLGSRST